MGPNGRRRLKRFTIAAPIAIGATVVVGLSLGAVAACIVGALGFLGVALVADDNVGTCFPLAVLFVLIVILLMMALFGAVMISR